MPAADRLAGAGPAVRKTAMTGLAGRALFITGAAAAISRATSSASVANGGMYTAMIASISSAAPSRRSARPYCAAVALATTSTGFRTAACGGRPARNAAWVPSDSSGTSRPAASQASATRIPGPPPLVSTATRRPAGTGWADSTAATSNISSSVPARMTPAWWNSASTATSPAASAAVCEDAARRPAPVRPDFTATIGLCRDTRRAILANRRGSGTDSR